MVGLFLMRGIQVQAKRLEIRQATGLPDGICLCTFSDAAQRAAIHSAGGSWKMPA